MLTITLLGTAATMPLPDRALTAALALGEGKCARVLMLTARTTGRKALVW